jgi:hypothetical protein
LVKFGMRGSGTSSDQTRMFSSPEEERASRTIHGPIAATAPAAAVPFRRVRRVKRRAAAIIATLDPFDLRDPVTDVCSLAA